MDLLARGRTVTGSIKSSRTQGGQIAAAESGIRNQVSGCGAASMRTDALVIGEEEQLVFDDAAADAPAELIEGERVLPLGRIFEEIPGIKLLVAVVLVGGPMEGVRTALAYDD